jgi:hypothetical protein
MSVWFVTSLGAVAEAADVSAFAGDWAIDPTRSDDPTAAVTGVVVGTTMGTDARAYAPDGGEEPEGNETRDRLLADVYALLGASGRMTIRPENATTVDLALSGEESVRLEVDGGWERFERSDGETCRIRVRETGDKLILERRLRSTRVFETMVPPEADGLLVVVVRVDGSVVEHSIEFRRVYRALDDAPTAAAGAR